MNNLSDYYMARDRIRTGDPIQFASDTGIGKVIQWWTKSEVNHTAMAIRFKDFEEEVDRVFIIEALEHGLQLSSLSERLKTQKGRAYWLPLNEQFNLIRKKIGGNGLLYLGNRIKYDYQGCILGNMFGRAKKDATKLFCSEAFWLFVEKAVLECSDTSLQEIVIHANKYLNGEAPTPADIRYMGITKARIQIL